MSWTRSTHSWYFFFFILFICFACSEKDSKEPNDLPHFSEGFLRTIQAQKNTASFQDSLEACSMCALRELTKNQDAHVSFWLNIYNASVQVQLQKGLDKYADKDRFFNSRWIDISGKTFSLNDIELGILGQQSRGKGAFIQKIRSKSFDPRVHFALNCGANSCPPIRIYSPETVQDELDQATRAFLQNNSSYSALTNTLTVDELFKWYSTDFKGEKGIIALHQKYGIVPRSATPKLVYSTYDWTVNPEAFEVQSKH